jgi:hypothetical protein
MKRRATPRGLAALGVLFVGAVGLGGLGTSADAAANIPTLVSHHACTRTSSERCSQGGEFCKQSEYGRLGWDANGRRYICRRNHVHPHWERP